LATSSQLSFKVERWPQFWPDLQKLQYQHWQELALDRERIKLGVDDTRFGVIDEQGLLHILTVRDEGNLVGYFLAVVMAHLHYKDAGLMAFTDMYFVIPEYRVGGCGVKMFMEVERTLRERGVVKIYLSCKVHQDHSELFEALGYNASDISFTKYIGT
jgi:GNAT superfamily N-acetyltransferase